MLPTPYEDELFYSVVARFADRMGLLTPPAVAQLVFGLSRITPTVEIPPRLDRLIPRLLPHSPFTPDELIANHSLVPYFTAFMGEDRAEAARAAVLAADAIRAFARLGINAIQNPLTLRLCTGCVASDREEEREPYWRRRHQLPGVAVCAAHNLPLQEGVSVRGDEWAGFVSISRMSDAGMPTQPVAASAPRETLIAVATASAILLDRDCSLRGGDLASRFFRLLQTGDWQYGRRIASTKLMAVVTERLGADVLADIGVHHPRYNSRTDPSLRGRSTDWLAQCLRVRGSVSHPLPYLLLLLALDIDAASLLDEDPGIGTAAERTPVLDKPCGNPVCPDADLPVPRPLPGLAIEGMIVIRCETCGFAYRQSPNASLPRQKRIVDFGSVWDDALRHECENGDATKLEIQDRLGLDIYTIKRRALDLGLWHPRWGKQTRETTRERNEREWIAKREESRWRYRAKWMELAAHAPGAGRREIGRLDEVTYQFVRTHDADWLDKVTPLVARRQPGSSGRGESDAHLANLIRDAAEDIRAARPPKQVTRAAVARALGKTVLRLNAAKLPESVAALTAVAETPAEFAERRRAWSEGEEKSSDPAEPVENGR